MKNNFNFDKLNFMKNQLRNYTDELINIVNMLNVITEFNLNLTEKEMHDLSQVFFDIDIFNKSLLQFNIYIQKYYNNLMERIQED